MTDWWKRDGFSLLRISTAGSRLSGLQIYGLRVAKFFRILEKNEIYEFRQRKIMNNRPRYSHWGRKHTNLREIRYYRSEIDNFV